MDYVSFASQILGGVIATVLMGAFVRRLSLGTLGNVIVGFVGGSLGGLILADCLHLPPAGHADGTAAEPGAVILHIASGGAGGAALMIVTALIVGCCRR
jgi:hypothetical protein